MARAFKFKGYTPGDDLFKHDSGWWYQLDGQGTGDDIVIQNIVTNETKTVTPPIEDDFKGFEACEALCYMVIRFAGTLCIDSTVVGQKIHDLMKAVLAAKEEAGKA